MFGVCLVIRAHRETSGYPRGLHRRRVYSSTSHNDRVSSGSAAHRCNHPRRLLECLHAPRGNRCTPRADPRPDQSTGATLVPTTARLLYRSRSIGPPDSSAPGESTASAPQDHRCVLLDSRLGRADRRTVRRRITPWHRQAAWWDRRSVLPDP